MTAIGVVINPSSKKNRGHRHRPEALQRLVGSEGLVRQTASIAELESVLREFIDRGVRYWIADGGDGSLHWMLNIGRRLMADRLGAAAGFPLAVPTNGGTIDFVAKKVGIRMRTEAILTSLARAVRHGHEPPCVELDTLRVVGEPEDPSRPPFDRIGFACAVAGVGQRFFDQFYAYDKPGPGTIVRVIGKAALAWLAATPAGATLPWFSDELREYGRAFFQPVRAEVDLQGERLSYAGYTAVHAGSFDIDLGGVVRLFPLARQRGQLHLQAGSLGPMAMIRNLPNLYTGRKIRAHEIREVQGTHMRVRALGDEVLAPVIDGEICEALREVRIELGPPVRIPLPD